LVPRQPRYLTRLTRAEAGVITEQRRELDARRGRAKRTERARDRVWCRLFLSGVSMATIGTVYGVSSRTVQRVLRKRMSEEAAEMRAEEWKR
jgi:hypothetical protein